MSAQEIKAFMARYGEALSGKDKTPEVVNEFVADEGLRQHIAVFEAGFPRYWLKAEDMLIDGDKVALRATFGGTHTGDLMGIPPTGKEIAGEGIFIYRIKGGKIVEFWEGLDQLTIMQQLGVIPSE